MLFVVLCSYVSLYLFVFFFFFFSSRRRHTRCALVTGVQTCALPILLCLPIASALKPPPGNTRMATRSERTCGRYRRNDGWVRAFFSSASSLIPSCNTLEFSGHNGTSRRASPGEPARVVSNRGCVSARGAGVCAP